MSISSDPAWHKQRQQQMLSFVEHAITQPKLMIDTLLGRKVVANLQRETRQGDQAVEVKRLMTMLNVPDPELQQKLPLDGWFETTLTRNKWLIFVQTIGQLRVECRSPTKALIGGTPIEPMTPADVRKVIADTPLPKDVPQTLVIVSTSGFTLEARELAERTAGRTVVLAEPTDAGGGRGPGAGGLRAMCDALDPEEDGSKSERLRRAIDAKHADLLTGGLSAEALSAPPGVPLQRAEIGLKAWAKDNPHYTVKRIEGRLIAYRDGSAQSAGSDDMPLLDRIKSLFSRKDNLEKQISFLEQRRATLSNQQDQQYRELHTLEGRDKELREQFKSAESEPIRKRIVQQLSQLQKELARRQQSIDVLNKQANVISAHLHNIELERQGKHAKLPTADELAEQAAKAEGALADLEASVQVADEVAGISASSMSDEEQALYDELMAGSKQADAEKATDTPSRTPASPQRAPTGTTLPPSSASDRKEAEPG